jgi:hypothetical protein
LRTGFHPSTQPSVNHDFPASVNLFSGIFDYALGNKNRGDNMKTTGKPFGRHAKSALKFAVAAAVLALAVLPSSASAFSSPFTAMSGSWSGSGTITTSDGNKERIRCRAKYDVDSGGSTLDLTLRCAKQCRA